MIVTDSHAARLLRLRPADVLPSQAEALEQSAAILLADAQASVDEGAIRGAGHIPSSPGEPPNSDTGTLVDSGFVSDVVETPEGLATSAGFSASYAGYLELGTSKMAERPFVRPATIRNRDGTLLRLAKRFWQTVGLP